MNGGILSESKTMSKARKLQDEFYAKRGDLEPREIVDLYRRIIASVRNLAEEGDGEAQYIYALHFGDMNSLGLNYSYNDEKAFFWHKKSADSGYFEAYNHVATMYDGGFGTQKNLSKAFEYYRKGVEANDQLAIDNLRLFLQENPEFK